MFEEGDLTASLFWNPKVAFHLKTAKNLRILVWTKYCRDLRWTFPGCLLLYSKLGQSFHKVWVYFQTSEKKVQSIQKWNMEQQVQRQSHSNLHVEQQDKSTLRHAQPLPTPTPNACSAIEMLENTDESLITAGELYFAYFAFRIGRHMGVCPLTFHLKSARIRKDCPRALPASVWEHRDFKSKSQTSRPRPWSPGFFIVGDISNAQICGPVQELSVLLLVVRHSRTKWRHIPIDVNWPPKPQKLQIQAGRSCRRRWTHEVRQ